ncbi:hypothetical protein CPB86DRAFT_164465 [Serendipita vermifera]|nr:hypothetical protein CPB86DRAFT_164465 [Serendipita vermifera]
MVSIRKFYLRFLSVMGILLKGGLIVLLPLWLFRKVLAFAGRGIGAAYSMQPPCGSSSTGVIVADGARANVQGNQIYNGPVYQAPVHQAPVFHFNMCSGVMFLFCLVCVLLVFYPGIRYIRADSQARLGPSNSSPSLNRTRRGGTFRGRGHVRLPHKDEDDANGEGPSAPAI